LATAVLLPMLLTEFGDRCPWLAQKLVRWSAHRLRNPEDRARYEEEWVANLNEVPGKLGRLVAALGFLASVPRMRATLGRTRSQRTAPVEAATQLPQTISATDVNETATDTPNGGVLDERRVGPAMLRMMMGAELRRLREARGFSRHDAGDSIRASYSKISRLELGRTSFNQCDVADLLTLYGVIDETERTRWLELVKRTNDLDWWHEYGDVMRGRSEQLGLEQAASVIRSYEVQFLPELLQTPDYARA
jgi:transcriptional regulator with XRE-family HTH domain